MNTSKLSTLLMVILFMSAACTKTQKSAETAETEAPAEATETVETTATAVDLGSVVWTGSKVIGDEHTGTLAIKENNLTFAEGQLTGGSIVVDMTSITDTDLEGEWKTKLEGHLNSDDFFGTATYPTSTLSIKTVEVGTEPNTLSIKGDLTIKETTLEESFIVMVSEQDGQTVYSTTLEIDRTKYDVKYGSNNFFDNLGDKAINDSFKLDVKIVSNRS